MAKLTPRLAGVPRKIGGRWYVWQGDAYEGGWTEAPDPTNKRSEAGKKAWKGASPERHLQQSEIGRANARRKPKQKHGWLTHSERPDETMQDWDEFDPDKEL